jgi:hypothetical protein
MQNNKIYFIVGCLFFFVSIANAQYSNFKCKWIIPQQSNVVKLDSLTIVPSSIQIKYPSGLTYTFDVTKGEITFYPSPLPDSILVCYRTYSFQLSKKIQNRDFSIYDSIGGYREYLNRSNYTVSQREELFSTPGINKTGTISRGISVGNNQSVFVNSNLNLQLEGQLTDNIKFTGVISDQNIPFQPEGNTQLLQQFDRVYIQFKSPKTTLTAGDVVLQNKGYFLNYYRNIQGGNLQHIVNIDSLSKSTTHVGAGVSKGKFSSMLFTPGSADTLSEGVQGPYRIKGPNGERFITIIANSEKVYLDGRLLIRGFDYDYVIDYNQSEVTFTPKNIITKYSRVRIDFEYSDKNYGRSNIVAGHEYINKQNKYSFQYYSEKDNPNNPLLLDLSDENKQYLSTIGDDLSKSFVSGVDSVGYTAGRTLYKRRVIGVDTIYEYSTQSDSAIYEIRFTKVNMGQGDYVLSNSSNNTRFYKYAGKNQGDYLPVQFIVTPKLKRMITASIEQSIGATNQLIGDIAYSKNNINLYSENDKGNDDAISARLGWKWKQKINPKVQKHYFNTSVIGEFNDKNFIAIDRFRSADFERYWSEDLSKIGNNYMLNSTIELRKNTHNFLSYQLNYRNKESDFNGIQNQGKIYHQFSNLYFKADVFQATMKNEIQTSKWNKHSINLYYQFKTFTPGIVYSTEINAIRDSLNRLKNSTMNFDEYKLYLNSSDTSKVRFQLNHAVRTDRSVNLEQFVKNTYAQTTNGLIGFKITNNQTLNINSTYRYLNYYIKNTGQANEETFMGRADWNANVLDRHVRSDLTVSTGTGREIQKQFVFQPVATGLGTHVWRDFNNDKIQDISEFVEKIYNDTLEFVKIYLPTDTYFKVFTNLINYRLDAQMPRNWKNSSNSLKKIASKFSNNISFAINKKTTQSDLLKRFSPINPYNEDSSLLGFQRSIREALFYNRASAKYGFDLTYSSSVNKQFLTQGFENRVINDWILGGRVAILRTYSLKVKTIYGKNAVYSDFNKLRNFIIEYQKINIDLSYQPRSTIRLSALYNLSYKENVFKGSSQEYAWINDFGLEWKWNKLSQRTFTAIAKYLFVKSELNGTSENSPVVYELQEALLNGNNYTWNINWQERLLNGLQLTLTYEGRNSPGAPTIHTGRMQLSALF